MNKTKRIMAVLCALAVCASVLTACGGKDGSDKDKKSSSLTTSKFDPDDIELDDGAVDYNKLPIPEKKLVIDGEEVDTSELVVMTINDEYQVTFDEYRFFYFSALGGTGVDFSTIEDEEEKKEVYKLIKDYVENYIKRFYTDFILAKDNGIEFTTDMKNQIDVSYQTYSEEFDGAENFEKVLLSQYQTVDVWRNIVKCEILYNEVQEKLYGKDGKYYVSEDEFKEFAKTDGYAQVKHVLITFSSQAALSEDDMEGYDELTLDEKLSLKEEAYAELDEEAKKAVDAKAKTAIDDVMAKVTAGEDFDKLVEQYGWDPGMEESPDGYFITENTSFVEEFIDAAFKLKPGETSAVVESDYGYHILKREPVSEEYIEKNLEKRYEEYFNEYKNIKDNEIRTELIDGMKVTFFDGYDKLSYDSIS